MLQQALVRRGYRCFLDVESLSDGDFQDQILSVLKVTPNFLFLLTAGSLVHVGDPENHVRQELEAAVRLGRKIVVAAPRGCRAGFSEANLPESLSALSRVQVSLLDVDVFFEKSVDLIEARFEHRVRRFPFLRAAGVLAVVAMAAGISLALASADRRGHGDVSDRVTPVPAGPAPTVVEQPAVVESPKELLARHVQLLETIPSPLTADAAPASSDAEQRKLEEALERKMKGLVIPRFTIRPPATIVDAVDYFRMFSKDHDDSEVPSEHKGISFVLDLGTVTGGTADSFGDGEGNGDSAPMVAALDVANVSLYEALALVCKVTGFRFQILGATVAVCPREMTFEPFVVEFIDVKDILLSMVTDWQKQENSIEVCDKLTSWGSDEDELSLAVRGFFSEFLVEWPRGSSLKYLVTAGKLRVKNTMRQLEKIHGVLLDFKLLGRDI